MLSTESAVQSARRTFSSHFEIWQHWTVFYISNRRQDTLLSEEKKQSKISQCIVELCLFENRKSGPQTAWPILSSMHWCFVEEREDIPFFTCPHKLPYFFLFADIDPFLFLPKRLKSLLSFAPTFRHIPSTVTNWQPCKVKIKVQRFSILSPPMKIDLHSTSSEKFCFSL